MLKFTLTETEIALGDKDHPKNLESPLKVSYYKKEHWVMWDKAWYFSSDLSFGLFFSKLSQILLKNLVNAF